MIPSTPAGPVDMLVLYRAKKGSEDALLALVQKHKPTLDALGLSTAQPARIWRGRDRDGAVTFIESFQWKDAKAPEIAHQTPQVMAVWEPMDALMDGMQILEVSELHAG